MKKILFIPCILFFFTSIFYLECFGQAGILDPDFGDGGIVISPLGSNYDNINSVVLQPDGKIVAGGFYAGATEDFALARYNHDGSLDNTFGDGGIVMTDFSLGIERIVSVCIQDDGKIVAAGFTYFVGVYYFAVARYNTDGTLDITFDDDGKLTTAVGAYASIGTAMIIQSDGKIIVVGVADDGTEFINDFAVVRYNSDGSLDNSFSADGKLTTQINIGHEYTSDVMLQSDGKILVTGGSWNGTTTDFALVRYNVDGSPDNSFDTDGIVLTSIPDGGTPRTMAIQSDGKIIVAGSVGTFPDNNHFALVRYTTDGAVDNSFGDYGIATSEVGAATSVISSIAIQADGKIIAGGWINEYPDNAFAIARFNTNGNIDPTFGVEGVATSFIGMASSINDIIIQADSKIIAGGYSDDGSGYTDFTLARYISSVETVIENNDLFNSKITIYPNPTNAIITLSVPSVWLIDRKAKVKIYNNTCQIFKEILLMDSSIQLNVSNWPTGYYSIQVFDDLNNYCTGFIIQK